MKKGFPEELLYKLRWRTNWAKGKEGLEYLKHRKSRKKALRMEAAFVKLKKICVFSNMSKHENGRLIIHSFILIWWVPVIDCIIRSVLGSTSIQFKMRLDWWKEARSCRFSYAALRNSVFIWQEMGIHSKVSRRRMNLYLYYILRCIYT